MTFHLLKLTIGATCEPWVDTCTESSLPFLTVPASTVCDIEWHDNAIPLFQQCDTLAKLLDNAHVLVALTLVSIMLLTSSIKTALPKVIPGSAAVLPSYMLELNKFHVPFSRYSHSPRTPSTYCRSEPQIAALIPGQSSTAEASSLCVMDTNSGHFDNNIIWMLYLRLLNLLHSNLVRSEIIQGLHGSS